MQLGPGSVFANRFEIERAAGSGGMGTVYRAIDRYTGDAVALKLLRTDAVRLDSQQRFAREARLLSELRHPNIVSYVAHGQTPDGQVFLAMEWLDGMDLSERLSSGPLPVRVCLRILAQAADALSLAHSRGIIHRDLKPTNLFLVGGDVGCVKILDFGIAQRIVSSQILTRSGTLIGTPEYMAPEQARGSRNLTPAVDIFSLGCVLYECLTGLPPFAADHVAAVLVRILMTEPLPIEDRVPGVPAQIAELLASMLAKNPADRLADAEALRGCLACVVAPSMPSPRLALPRQRLGVEGFAEREQELISIVLASCESVDNGPRATQPGSGVHLAETDRRALLQALVQLGVGADFLANGMLVVTVPSMESAQDQATVAARAGLLIKERWPEASVAMATGRGMVQGCTAIGEVVDLAAHSLHRSGDHTIRERTSGVLIDALSAKLLAGRFAHIPQAEGALLLHEERGVDASRPLLGRPTPCVGRDVELGALEAQLAACIEESEARTVLFTAPPGAGKSRLRHEFLLRVGVSNQRVTMLLGRGDVMSAGAPYGILRDAMRKLCGISGSEPLDVQCERLRTRIALNLTVEVAARVVPFLGELCNVPFSVQGNPMLQAARQDPKILRDCLRRSFLDFIAAECVAAPVLLVLDDLQWGDPLLVSLVDEALHEQAKSPLLVLAFARPDVHSVFPKLWARHTVQQIPLRGLSRRACERLIHEVLGAQVPQSMIARAVEQSAGNALFLEEIIRSLAEGKAELQSDTVVAMLQARLGRLDANLRRAVRAASIFGQTVWRGGIAAILGLAESEPEVESWLAKLSEMEILQTQAHSRLKDQAEYRFRHALVRDATYSLLTDSDLQAGHLRAAEFLVAAGDSDAAALGEHFQKGGDLTQAAHAFTRAAALAISQAGLDAALRYIERGLRCGPRGELLGELRSIECVALFWMFELERAFSAAMEAMALLPMRSGSFCRALTIGCQVAIHGSAQAQMKLPELLPLLLTIDPEPQGLVHLIEGLSDMVATLGVTGTHARVLMVLSRLATLVHQSLDADPLIERWLCYSRCQVVHHHEPTPWKALQDSLRGIELAERAGDQRTRLKLEVLGKNMVMAELADPELPEHIRKSLSESGSVDDRLVLVLNRILLGLCLGTQSDPAAHEEALRHAEDIQSIGSEMTMAHGFRHLITAQVALHRRNPELAEAEIRSAIPLLEYVLLWTPPAYAILIRALLAQSRAAEAVQVAEVGLRLLADLGCVGCLEVELRTAITEAFHAAGDTTRSHEELRETLRQIELRADDIKDPFWRTSYLTRNPHCLRAQTLAREWGYRSTIYVAADLSVASGTAE